MLTRAKVRRFVQDRDLGKVGWILEASKQFRPMAGRLQVIEARARASPISGCKVGPDLLAHGYGAPRSMELCGQVNLRIEDSNKRGNAVRIKVYRVEIDPPLYEKAPRLIGPEPGWSVL